MTNDMTSATRDFQLLDDGDDDNSNEAYLVDNELSSPSSSFNNSINNSKYGSYNNSNIINTIKIQTKSNPVTMTVVASKTSTTTINNNTNKQTSKRTTTSTATTSTTNRFNISPNKPPTPGSSGGGGGGDTRKYEFKAIERPRSRPHSPLSLMRGIEEYAQQYASSNSINSTNTNKITMNLKMDDLLASSAKNETYQMLDDFSVLTGDIEELVSNHNYSSNKAKKAKAWNDGGGGGGGGDFNVNDADKSGDDDEGEDEDDNDNDNRNKNKDEDEKGKLKYKYTASYKIDEATGSFKENSKIIFENKNAAAKMPIRPPPPPPPPPSQASAPSRPTSIGVTNSASSSSYYAQYEVKDLKIVKNSNLISQNFTLSPKSRDITLVLT
jgi:hypothetical protein